MTRIFPCLAAGFLLFACVPPQGINSHRYKKQDLDGCEVRVFVLKTKGPVSFNAADKFVLREKESSKLLLESKGKKLTVIPEEIGAPIEIDAWDQPIAVNGVTYRGRLEMHNILGNIQVINVLPLGDYLRSVIPGEIPSKWGVEALKAQAVASRSYAYYHILKNKHRKLFDLDSTVNFQVYKGTATETPATSEAVDVTSGEIITYKGNPILAYFHSTCGGKTADDQDIWPGKDEPYLESVRCEFCKESPYYEWEARLSITGIREALGKTKQGIGPIKGVSFRIKAGRVTDVLIRHTQGTCNLKGNEFRLMVSPEFVKSTSFHSKNEGKTLILTGNGWGHGVGLCQWGAKGMAENGKSYKNILQHYYHGARIEKIKLNHPVF